MKTLMLGLILAGFTSAALAIDSAGLDNRIRALTAKFEAMQLQSDKCIPADTLSKAQGIILLDRTKAGFLFAYQGGGGIAMVKDPATGNWSPAAFLGASEASLGFQIGGEQGFYAILLMNTNAYRLATDPRFEFGGEARGTAGDDTAGQGAKITSAAQSVLVYDSRKGLYGGAAIKGGSLSSDEKANRIYYGEFVTMKDILMDHKVQGTEAAFNLAGKITEYSKPRVNSESPPK